MTYEIGKKYEFKRSEFDVSKEYGRVTFIIPNPASATPFRVKPFEFQANNIPEKIICTYRGGDRFEQEQNTYVPELYAVGQEYRFRVMRFDSGSGTYSLRDDINGLTFFPIDLGKHRFKRFERVQCRVLSTEGGWLKLEPVAIPAPQRRAFSFENVMALPQAAPFRRLKVKSDLSDVATLAEAASMFANGDSHWPITAMQIIAKNIPQWLAKAPERRAPWLQRLIDLTVALIESTDYITHFPVEERYGCRRALSDLVRGFEDYQRACALIADNADERMVKDTLATLRNSGWLYEPERKMRLLMAIFTLRNSYAHTYIGEIFSIIRSRHDDEGFMHLFKKGLSTMLSIYISNERKFLDPRNRQGTRDLIMALAIELLLTCDTDNAEWNAHRGLLYTCAILLLRQPASSLPRKALECYAERFDRPLEFSWRDLDDINFLCYNKLMTGPASPSADVKEIAVFESDKATMIVGPKGLSLMPAVISNTTKTAASYPVIKDCPFSIQLNGRLTEKPGVSDTPGRQHPMWTEAERMLFDPEKYPGVPASTASRPKNVKAYPEAGDEVMIRIVRQDPETLHMFHCEITDDFHTGRGTITTRDIVAYPVKAFTSTFEKDGEPLLLRAKVLDTDGEGNCTFSMRSAMTAFSGSLAREDRDSGEEIPAVITEVSEDRIWAVSNYGYPVMIFNKDGRYDDLKIHKNDAVYLTVTKVSYYAQTDGLFINGRIESVDESRHRDDNYRYVENCLQYILEEYAGGKTWQRPADETPADEEHDDNLTLLDSDDTDRIYLRPGALSYISQLLNIMVAADGDNDLPRSYWLLQMSHLIAATGGDLYRASFIEAKTDLIEALAKFAADGRIDAPTVDQLDRRCRQFADDDGDLELRLTVINLLGRLDQLQPAEGLLDIATAMTDSGDLENTITAKLARLVLSYNMLRGLKMTQPRALVMAGIYDLLSLPKPSDVDITQLNVREDQTHEFKQSLIFPADNKMRPDEKRQAREIMEVICGMLNSRDGGTLYLGVNNLGVPVGLHDDFVYLNSGFSDYDPLDIEDKFSLAFTHWIRTWLGVTQDGVTIYPDLVTLQYDDIADKRIARVTVRPFPGMAVMSDGTVYVRQESSTVPIKLKREQTAFAKKRREELRVVY